MPAAIDLVERTTQQQGLTAKIEDPATVARVVTLLRAVRSAPLASDAA